MTAPAAKACRSPQLLSYQSIEQLQMLMSLGSSWKEYLLLYASKKMMLMKCSCAVHATQATTSAALACLACQLVNVTATSPQTGTPAPYCILVTEAAQPIIAFY
jgi:hypothetical protein